MSATELTEAADFLEANGWLPTKLGTPAVEAVAAPLLPGDKGRIVAALREAAAGAPGPTQADRMLAARLVVQNLRRESLQGAIATALAAAREEGRASVGLGDFLPGGCDEEVRAPNYHFTETYGDWLECTRRKDHDGEHEHEDSGLTWPRDDKEPRS